MSYRPPYLKKTNHPFRSPIYPVFLSCYIFLCRTLDLLILLLWLFSHSVMSNSLQPHVLQHTRLHWPLLSPRLCSHSCPLSQWCHPTISSSVIPFPSRPESFPASGSFPVSWLFTSGGASASALILPVNIQGLFTLGMTSLISLHYISSNDKWVIFNVDSLLFWNQI